MKKRILLIAAIAVIAAAAFFTARAMMRPEEPRSLVLSGTVETDDVELSFRIPGRVIERAVSEGQSIASGRLVAKLDDSELRHQRDLAAAERDAAAAALAELEAGTRPEEIAQARAAARGASAEAERLRLEAARSRQLIADEVISQRELEAAETAARTSGERAKEAAHRVTLLENGPRRETIAQARARVRQAEANLEALETRLSFTILEAPLAGFVLAEHADAGEQVAAGTPVVTIADLQKVWIRAFVDETDLGRIHLGMPVTVRTDTFPEKTYRGRIGFIASDAEFTPKSVQTEKERVKLVYRVKIDVENSDLELKPGMPADGEIALAEPES